MPPGLAASTPNEGHHPPTPAIILLERITSVAHLGWHDIAR
jgi:hypothetical protein